MTRNQKYYRRSKERMRMAAIEFQFELETARPDEFDLIEKCKWFQKYGKRFGLMREFKENGIL